VDEKRVIRKEKIQIKETKLEENNKE